MKGIQGGLTNTMRVLAVALLVPLLGLVACASAKEEVSTGGASSSIVVENIPETPGLSVEDIAQYGGKSLFIPTEEGNYLPAMVYRMYKDMPCANYSDGSTYWAYWGHPEGVAVRDDFDYRQQEGGGVERRTFWSCARNVVPDGITVSRSQASGILTTDESFCVYKVGEAKYWEGCRYELNGVFTEIEGIEGDGQESSEGGRYFSDDVLAEALGRAGIYIKSVFEWSGDNSHSAHWNGHGLWISDSPTVLSAGSFEGTKWTEYSQPFKTAFYIAYPEVVLEQTPTKEGYFEYDLSSLEPGEYLFIQKGERLSPEPRGGNYTGCVVSVVD